VPFDPWAGARLRLTETERQALHPSERPPMSWSELSQQQRELLGGLAHAVLRAHGPALPARRGFIRARLVEALHATHEPAERGGYGDDLTGYLEPDTERRVAWRRLDFALARPPLVGSALLDELVSALGAAGDLVATLRSRRAAIDEQLARAERTGGA
jgi:hypothetical protein